MIIFIGTRNSIAVQLQFDAVDLSMKLSRYEEEVQQVMREMRSYLLYFKDTVLPQLHHSAKGKYTRVTVDASHIHELIILPYI